MTESIILAADVNWVESLTAITTVIGTIFLIWTFSEQRKITAIEQINFRIKHLPTFECTKVMGSGNEPDLRNLSFTLIIHSNPIQKLRIGYFENPSIKFENDKFDDQLVQNVGEEITFYGHYLYSMQERIGFDELKGGFSLNFVDSYNNLYTQDFIIKPTKVIIQSPVFKRQLESVTEI